LHSPLLVVVRVASKDSHRLFVSHKIPILYELYLSNDRVYLVEWSLPRDLNYYVQECWEHWRIQNNWRCGNIRLENGADLWKADLFEYNRGEVCVDEAFPPHKYWIRLQKSLFWKIAQLQGITTFVKSFTKLKTRSQDRYDSLNIHKLCILAWRTIQMLFNTRRGCRAQIEFD